MRVAGFDTAATDHINMQTALIEEGIIVSLVIFVFLFHFRSALIPILTLLIAVVLSFVPMYYLHISSNIMSLGGLALAVGVLVDAAIVMVGNGYRRLSEQEESSGPDGITKSERRRILIDSAKQVGPALFFSLVIIVISFLPVFLLEAQEGRLFRPLAWTKTLSLAFSSLLAITVVPSLMVSLIRESFAPKRGIRSPDSHREFIFLYYAFASNTVRRHSP
jgi:copper/silver efflux system protein